VYLDDLLGNDPQLVFDTSLSSITTTTTITGLTPGKTYDITVTAVNSIGESLESTVLTIYAGTLPSKITDVSLKASTTTSITVQWTPPSSNGGLSLTKYTIYYDVG
jgi:hypothetical protein